MRTTVTSFNTEITLVNIAKAILDWCYQQGVCPADFEYEWNPEKEEYTLPEWVPEEPIVQFLNCAGEILAQNWIGVSNTYPTWQHESRSAVLNDCNNSIFEEYGINICSLTWTLSRSKIDRVRFVKIGNNLYDIWNRILVSDSDNTKYPKSKYLLTKEKERYC